MVAAVPDRYRALILFAAGTGLRQGECFGLTLDRVDFLRRQVRVDRQLVAALAPSRVRPPKSTAGFRTVPEVVSSVLAAHLARYRPSRHGLVFTSRRGNASRDEELAAWGSYRWPESSSMYGRPSPHGRRRATQLPPGRHRSRAIPGSGLAPRLASRDDGTHGP